MRVAIYSVDLSGLSNSHNNIMYTVGDAVSVC